jgi:hypothetical protein
MLPDFVESPIGSDEDSNNRKNGQDSQDFSGFTGCDANPAS